jgi:glycosyltransferase involved in cell wall biosynthesis
MAYARGLLDRYGDCLEFAAVHPLGRYGRLPRDKALAYLDMLEARWTSVNGNVRQKSIGQVLPTLIALLPRRGDMGTNSVYVQASPNHLTNPRIVRSILEREQARFLCLVHDLIPIEYPEYARPNGADQHRARIETITQLADSIIVYSDTTRRALEPWINKAGRSIEIRRALLGAHNVHELETLEKREPYFLCVGTIEPRKNHLLLLNLWRHLAQTQPVETIPRLVIVGRRGWENEQILDMLDRCPAVKSHVEELNGCPDRTLYSLMRDASALLMPSFVEGFGLPVIESLSVGTPVICSDIPAHREAGGIAPDYLDPLDGPAWKEYILDHFRAGPHSVAQTDRMKSWVCPTWADHIQTVCEAVDALQKR